MQKEFTPVMRYIVVSLSKLKTYLVTSYKNCFNKVMSWEKNSFMHQVRGKTWPSVYHSISKSINIADLLLPTFKLPFPVHAGSAFSHSLPQAVLFEPHPLPDFSLSDPFDPQFFHLYFGLPLPSFSWTLSLSPSRV